VQRKLVNFMGDRGKTLTRLAPDYDPGIATLSRGAGEGLPRIELKTPLPSIQRGRGHQARRAWWVRVRRSIASLKDLNAAAHTATLLISAAGLYPPGHLRLRDKVRIDQTNPRPIIKLPNFSLFRTERKASISVRVTTNILMFSRSKARRILEHLDRPPPRRLLRVARIGLHQSQVPRSMASFQRYALVG
jgi:hypothetical protein